MPALILVLFGLVLADGAAVTWQAMGKAKLIEEDLTTAKALLPAGGFEAGSSSSDWASCSRPSWHSGGQQQLDHRALTELSPPHPAGIRRCAAASHWRPRTYW